MNTTPTQIDVSADRLFLAWSDGFQVELGAPSLRAACQCASCVSEVTGQGLLDKNAISPNLKLSAAEPMGNYAISLSFSDSHSTGIYTFVALRKIAEELKKA